MILGIDTGGTYTDGVIVEYGDKKILHKAKSLTTREDLTIGIEKCMRNLNFRDFGNISLVSLSTTLATNAIVEGKGCKTGVILIGDWPKGKLPSDNIVLLDGKFDIKGRVIKNLEGQQVGDAIEQFRGKVDAIAISGYASVRNPEHELYVKSKVREMLNIPVACGHELTSSLGFYERTVTSILNASLIPIIMDLINATKTVLQKYKINVPIMIVKGDGSLMHESLATEKPIETILSGPAASIIGGIFLTDQNDAIIMDMGGTTTDIAILMEGVVRKRREGAQVGGWLTRVEAAEIFTFGIGGDSYLHINMEGQLEIGPQKVWPLCVLGKRYPHLSEELETFRKKEEYQLCSAQKTDCFMLVKKPGKLELGQLEMEIIKILEERPHSLLYIAHKLDKNPDHLELQPLVDTGVIARISLTPTDILHAEGRYNKWDKRIAEIGVNIFAERLNQSIRKFLDMANEFITNKLCYACLLSLSEFENQSINFIDKTGPTYLRNKDQFGVLVKNTLKKPIVAVGAPVSAWMHKVSEKLNTSLMIPEHSEVANAVGAAVGQVMETVEVLIRPDQVTTCFIVHAPWSRESFNDLESSVEYAISGAKKYVAATVKGAMSNSYNVNVLQNREDIYTEAFTSNTEDTYVETRIKVIAIGKPSLKVSFVE
ncbi:hydantoinase/oxoprolinase family protein [Peribacillus sp. FSL K6-1552]|uniref:hydantoinase/oxoprolinase family protein n=1 Tax=Peribacillus sp. FSL K6-1552 TaxID=2954514 RepID=UPI0030F9CC16